MGYKKAEEVLPREVLVSVQRYIDGQMLYIPRKTQEKRSWGSATDTKRKLELRNESIYAKYQAGKSVKELSVEYFLTEKSVQRIIRKMKPSWPDDFQEGKSEQGK